MHIFRLNESCSNTKIRWWKTKKKWTKSRIITYRIRRPQCIVNQRKKIIIQTKQNYSHIKEIIEVFIFYWIIIFIIVIPTQYQLVKKKNEIRQKVIVYFIWSMSHKYANWLSTAVYGSKYGIVLFWKHSTTIDDWTITGRSSRLFYK